MNREKGKAKDNFVSTTVYLVTQGNLILVGWRGCHLSGLSQRVHSKTKAVVSLWQEIRLFMPLLETE